MLLQNFGDESDAKGLMSPSLYSQHGVYAKDLLGPRSKQEVRMCDVRAILLFLF